MNIGVLISSYHRRERLLSCVDSILRTRTHRLKILLDYDNLAEEKERRYIDSVFNENLPNVTSDLLVITPDDITFHPETIGNAVKCFEDTFKDLDGLVELRQENVPSGGCGVMMIGRDFYSRFPSKVFMCPDYKHFYKDLELRMYAQLVNRYVRCNEANVFHHNPNYCNEPPDETYTTLRENIKQLDVDIWNKRQSLGYLWGKDFNLVNNGSV